MSSVRFNSATENSSNRIRSPNTQKRTWKLQEFVAHGANVNCLALGQKSGRVLVTGGDDKKVNLWAVGKPNCILSLSGHSTAVECVRFGGSEELVCAGSLSGALKIWDLEATKIVRTLTGHKANIRSIDFHPYGDFICTGSLDTNIKLWDIRRKGCIFTYKGHNLAVNSLKFSPDGQWIASAGEDSVVKLWDLRAGKMLTEFSSHTGPVNDVQFHPHEFLLASSSHDRTVNIWDLERFSLVSSTDADTGPIRSIVFHPSGDCIYAGATDILKVYGWEPSRTFDTVAMGWGKVQDVAIAQNQLIGATFHGIYVSLYVIDLKRVQPFGGPEHDASVFRHGAAIRKSFSKDKSTGKASCDAIKIEEASDTGGDEPQEEDPPPEITNIYDYNNIFRTQRELQRTPPPLTTPPVCLNSSENNNDCEIAAPEIQRPLPPAKPSSLVGSNYSETLRKTASTSSVPRAAFPQRSDSNSNVSSPSMTPAATLPNLCTERRASTSGGAGDNSHQSVYSHRSRASSETRREVHVTSVVTPDQDSYFMTGGYHIRQSPSEPYLIRQQSSPGPPPMSSPVHRQSPTLPQLARPDTYASYGSRQERSPASRSPYSRHSVTGASDSETHSSTSTKPSRNSDVTISYMGSAKEPDYTKYNPDKLSQYPEYGMQHAPEYRPDRNGVNFEDFLPKFGNALSFGGNTNGLTGIAGTEMSEQEVISSIVRGHSSMMSVVSTRTRGLQVTQKLWHTKDLRAAVEHALNTGDQSVLVDFLSVLNLRPSIWNLDILTLLLSPVSLLLQSKYESYVSCGSDSLKLMIKNFAPMIKSNMQGPVHSVGIDISREERYNKCVECYNHMISIKAFLLKRQTVPGKLGHMYRELAILMQAFD